MKTLNVFLVTIVVLLLIGSKSSSLVESYASPSSMFGDIQTILSTDIQLVPVKEVAVNRRTIFRTFYTMSNIMSSMLGSVPVQPGYHVVAKYDSQLKDYVWTTSIDSGSTCGESILLPSCDQESVILVLVDCHYFPLFNMTAKDATTMIKFDRDGQYVWHKKVASTYPTVASVNCDENNEDIFFLSGIFQQSIQLDNITLAGGSDTAFIARLDHNATAAWATKATSVRADSLASDDQHVYLAGALQNGIFDDRINIDGINLFLATLNKNNGEFLRITPFPAGSYLSDTSISVGPEDTIYLSGYVFVSVTFGDTTIQSIPDKSFPSMFLAQYNRTNGEVVWAKSLFPEGMYHAVPSSTLDRYGSIHLVGFFNCTANLDKIYSCNAEALTGFYAKLTGSGEVLSFLTVQGIGTESDYISVTDDGYISVFGAALGPVVHFQYGPTVNTTDPFFFYFTEILEPKIDGLSVVPEKGLMLYDYFLFNTTDELFSTYRFGFFNAQKQKVFLCEWDDNRVLNTTLPISGNVTVFVQALSNADQIVEWTSTIELLEPKTGEFKVAPSKGLILYDYFQFSTTDALFSTYRFGFFNAEEQRVFLSEWDGNRVLNTTISIAGNVTVFVQALSKHNAIVEWTSTIELLDPMIGQLTVVPNRGAKSSDYFLFNTTDELFSTYRFGFFDLKGERVFLNQWNDSRILNTTISTTGNFTVFAQALTNHDQIVEWTSSIEVYQIEGPKNNTDNGNNGNNNNHVTSPSKRKMKAYAIALIVLACVFVILIALALIATLVALVFFMRRKRKGERNNHTHNNDQNNNDVELRSETK